MANEHLTEAGQPMKTYTVGNPHPLFGKDDNIINEFGHSRFPMYVHKYDDKGKITHTPIIVKDERGNDHLHSRDYDSRIVNNEDELEEAISDGFTEKWVKPEKVRPVVVKTDKPKAPGWDTK